MNIIAVGRYAIVEPTKKTKTESGLHIPESANLTGLPTGVVVSPPDPKKQAREVDTPIKPGATIVYRVGMKITVDGEEYEAVEIENIVAILEED